MKITTRVYSHHQWYFHPFTIIELLTVITIIVILAALLLPAIITAKSKAHYATWSGYKRNIQSDASVVAYYTFEKGEGFSVENIAYGAQYTETVPEYFNGILSSSSGPRWKKGRWNGKNTLHFDGIDDRVELGSWSPFPADTSLDEMSIAAWFKADSFGTADARIISKAITTATDDHWFMLSTMSSGGDIRLRVRIKAGGSTAVLIAGSGALEIGVWVFATATYDGNKIRLYKDGEPVGSLAKSGVLDFDDTAEVWIGANPSHNRYFHGLIGEITIFTRALSAEEVKGYYKMTRP